MGPQPEGLPVGVCWAAARPDPLLISKTTWSRLAGISPPHFRPIRHAIQAPSSVREAMRHICVFGLAALLLSAWFGTSTQAQGAGGLRIEWEVKHRFRLFRSEADFQRHVAAFRSDGVLGAERRLAISSDGRGWARDTVERLCIDRAGRLMETCDRDGVRENYLAPRDHPVSAI